MMNNKDLVHATSGFTNFNRQVTTQLTRLLESKVNEHHEIDHLLNGAASEALNREVSKSVRSANGIFFSGKVISALAASLIADKLATGCSVGDPSCGAGDLLLACARHFETAKEYAQTLSIWNSRVWGLDIHPEFVTAARSRLKLLAATRHDSECLKISDRLKNNQTFCEIKTGDYFTNIQRLSKVDCLIMNPPFITEKSPIKFSWGTGKVQLAGVFLDTALRFAKQGQEIVAILPDVLRSGIRYERWRKTIEQNALIKKIIVYGRFDQKTDVDVFIIHLVKKNNNKRLDFNWMNSTSATSKQTLSSLFNVTVGAYVPFRAQNDKRTVKFLCVQSATPNTYAKIVNICKFDGRLDKPPFVVIRRTSNPADTRRLVPSLVIGKDNIAVENHLIILSPIDGTIGTCKKLMEYFLRPEADNWMNNVSRCRHLTVGTLKLLPIEGLV